MPGSGDEFHTHSFRDSYCLQSTVANNGAEERATAKQILLELTISKVTVRLFAPSRTGLYF